MNINGFFFLLSFRSALVQKRLKIEHLNHVYGILESVAAQF